MTVIHAFEAQKDEKVWAREGKGWLNTHTCIVPQFCLLSFQDPITLQVPSGIGSLGPLRWSPDQFKYTSLHSSEGPALIDDSPAEDSSSSSEPEPNSLIPTNLVFFTLLGVVGGTDAAACGTPFRATWRPRWYLHQETMSRAPRGSGSYESF